jgi:hypothetical protein
MVDAGDMEKNGDEEHDGHDGHDHSQDSHSHDEGEAEKSMVGTEDETDMVESSANKHSWFGAVAVVSAFAVLVSL